MTLFIIKFDVENAYYFSKIRKHLKSDFYKFESNIPERTLSIDRNVSAQEDIERFINHIKYIASQNKAQVMEYEVVTKEG